MIVRIPLLTLFLSISIIGGAISCGGGGDGAADDDLHVLDEYLYSMTTPPGTIYAGFDRSEGATAYAYTISINLQGDGLAGTYNQISGSITLSDQSGSINVNTDLGQDPLFGSFTILVTQTFIIPEDGPPTAGAVEISSMAGDVLTALVSSDAGGSGVPGVEILYDEDDEDPFNTIIGPLGYAWTDFEELFGSDTAESYELKAAFSFELIGFLFDQMSFVVQAFEQIDDNEELLPAENPVTAMCDAFSENTTPIDPPPAGIPDQGTMEFQWEDSLSDGEVGPGDNFSMSFTDCWVNDQSDEYDDLIEGSLDFTGYIDVVEVVDDVETLTLIGFETITFVNFGLSETYENPPGVCTLSEDGAVTIDGTFHLSFFAP